jgi:ribosomal protein S18 acetylase RimI-like enzyme
MKIQKLSNQHVKGAAQLLEQDWLLHAKETRSYDYGMIVSRDIDEWLVDRVLNKDDFGCLVGTESKAVVGLILYRVVDNISISPRQKSIKIEDVIIAESFRGNGLAKQLIAELEREASSSDIFELSGDIYSFNDISKGLFESLGYSLEYSNYMKIVDKDNLKKRVL